MTETVHERLARSLEAARLGGKESTRKKITDSGKLLVRQRLELLFDNNEYIEDGLLASL